MAGSTTLCWQGKVLWGLRVPHKILPPLWTRNRWRALWPHPHKGQVGEHDAVTVICSVLDVVDYFYQHALSPPFTYLIDPRTSSTAPMIPTVTSPSSTLACKSLCPFFHHLFSATSPPKSSKTLATEIWFPGMIASTHIHKQNTSSFSLSVTIEVVVE